MNEPSQPAILFLGKAGHWAAEKAAAFLENHAPATRCFFGAFGERFPEIGREPFDLLVSFSAPWVVKADVLSRPRVGAINFHPGSPAYPGIGCTNFALYDDAQDYGVTCHRMEGTVDSGAILGTRTFPVYRRDSVKTLTDRAYFHMTGLFFDVMGGYFRDGMLPAPNGERWLKRPYTRQELDALCEIRAGMDEQEIRRRVRATYFSGKPGPYVMVAGRRFVIDPSSGGS